MKEKRLSWFIEESAGDRILIDLKAEHLLILKHIELLTSSSLADLAAKLSLPLPKVRSVVQVLQDQKIIGEMFPIIDTGRLDFQTVGLFFTPSYSLSLKEYGSSFLKTPGIVWWESNNGEYTDHAVFCTKGIHRIAVFFEELSNIHGDFLRLKKLYFPYERKMFGKRFLSPESESHHLELKESEERVSLDEFDQKLLRYIGSGMKTLREISADLGSSPATISRRIKGFEDLGVIKGYRYRVDLSVLKYRWVYGLVRFSNVSSQVRKELFEYALQEPHITIMQYCIGDFDLILGVECNSDDDYLQIRESFHARFAKFIDKISWCEHVKVHKASYF